MDPILMELLPSSIKALKILHLVMSVVPGFKSVKKRLMVRDTSVNRDLTMLVLF